MSSGFKPPPLVLPAELVVDARCFLGCARAMSYCLDDENRVLGRVMYIECLAVPGSGRLQVTGRAKKQNYDNCQDALHWLFTHGPLMEGRGFGKPRLDPTTVGQLYDVSE